MMSSSPRSRAARWPAVITVLAALATIILVATSLVSPTMPAFACGTGGCPTTPPVDPGGGTPPPLPPLISAVIGDSYSSGEGGGQGNYQPAPGGGVDWSHKSGLAPEALAWDYLSMGRKPLTPYTPLTSVVRTFWGTDRLQFMASSGATTYNLDHPQMDPADPTVQRSVAQLSGVSTSTNLIYYGFGGNDAHFAELFETALTAFVFGNQNYNATQGMYSDWRVYQTNAVSLQVSQLLATMPTVRANTASALAKVWQQAPGAQIVVSLYPQGVKQSGNVDIPFIAGTALDAMYPFAVALNTAIRQGVADFQSGHPGAPTIRVFDPNTAGPGGTSIVAGHEVGQPNTYFNPLAPNMGQLYTGHLFHGLQESFHPNQFGDVALGKALATFVAGQFPAWFPYGPNFSMILTNPQKLVDNTGVDSRFAAWVQVQIRGACSLQTGNICSAKPPYPGVGGGNPDLDPANGGYIAPTYGTGDIEAWLAEVWLAQQAAAAGQGTGVNLGPNGPSVWQYVQDPALRWYYQYLDANGNQQTIQMPPGWAPPPGMPLMSDPGTPVSPGNGYDDPGDPGGGAGGPIGCDDTAAFAARTTTNHVVLASFTVPGIQLPTPVDPCVPDYLG